jgi:hypothetical protein
MTNRIRMKADAQLLKVQQQNRQAVSYVPLQSAFGCRPNYSVINYPTFCRKKCVFSLQAPVLTISLDHGTTSMINSLMYSGPQTVNTVNTVNTGDIIYDGGASVNTNNIIYDGGRSVNTNNTIYDGGRSVNNR